MSFPSYPIASLRLAAVLTYAFLLPFCLLAQNATPNIQFSPAGGLFNGPLEVLLSSTTPNAVLYYTLDGSEPDVNAAVYTNALPIDTNTIVRVRAFAPGLSPSPVMTQSYFVDLQHTFPVVSLAFPPPAFFDSTTGIYTNYTNGLSVVANIEFFEPGDTVAAAVNQLVEVEIQGTGSIVQAQKSLEIKAKKSLGLADINYPIFPDLPYASYKRLVLRNSGQDWCVLQFRDEFATSLVGDLSDLHGLLTPPHLFLQGWRPAVVYLNGKYWGIHNVRERMTQFYVRQHFNWTDSEYDLIENYGEAITGDSIAWFQFVHFLQVNEFSSDAQFAQLRQQIDYQNYLDYCVYNVYLENEDWPGNNVRRFKHRSPAGKWQWLTYDLDFTFGLYQSNGWNTGSASPNALGRLLDSTALAWPNPDWSTLLFRRCWQNATFRRDFANRMADMLNTNLLPTRIYQRLDQFQALYEPEIAAHYQRWWGVYISNVWLDNIAKTRSFAKQRPAYVRKEITAALPEASGLAYLIVDASPRQGGSLHVSTVHPDSTHFPWPGIYFKGVAVPVKAIAQPGFRFIKWSDTNLGSADSINVLVENTHSLTAYFERVHEADNPETVSTLEINLQLQPATNALTIRNSLIASSDFQVQIIDALGRVILERNYAAQSEEYLTLEAAHLLTGTYFLRVTFAANGWSGTKGFVKF